MKIELDGAHRDDFEVIDGQQRLNALYEYVEGAYPLFHPIEDEEEARYPAFIKDRPCGWGGKRFDELEKETQLQLLNTPLAIVMVKTDEPNEARDLFIRLQAGMPLNSQEKRDAWPGHFTEYVLKVGGKPEIPKYPGFDFFAKVMGAKTGGRGEFRQLAAQLFMLYLARREAGNLCDINRDEIDTFYYKHLMFDMQSPVAKRFEEILKLLTQFLGDGKRKKVIGHEAIHLLLLVDKLLDDYTRSWTNKIAPAFDLFRQEVLMAKETRDDPMPGEFYLRYGSWTRTNTDRADTIQRRHEFFAAKMYEYMQPVLKDPTRIFGALEKDIIYYRDKKRCQRPGCGADVLWSDAEFHHVELHSKGGPTVISNGALVHKACHPKSEKATNEFVDYWVKKREAVATATAVAEPAEETDTEEEEE
jgi:HNH endonuclease